MSTTGGIIYIHSAVAALRPHIEWAIAGVLGVPVELSWTPQTASPGTFRTECSWSGTTGTLENLVSTLRVCSRVRFEVTQDAQPGLVGQRYSFTPNLGMFSATTNSAGDIVVDENRLRAALRSAELGLRPVAESLKDLLGEPWDAELEVFRYAGANNQVRWLYAV